MSWAGSSSIVFLGLAVVSNVAHNSALKVSTERDGAKRLAIVAFALPGTRC